MEAYRETFDDGPGGWYGYADLPGQIKHALEWEPGRLTSRSPWWIDYNHAPPGVGYFHMLFCLHTRGPLEDAIMDAGGHNRYISGGFPACMSDARVTVRSRGELYAQGAKVSMLVQGMVDGICSGWVLTADTFDIGEDWGEQTITLDPDPDRWTALGSRYNRTDTYGVKPLDKVLKLDVVNIMLLLFPIDVVPMGPIEGDMHRLRPGREYPVWRHKLPEGYVTLDEVRMEFP